MARTSRLPPPAKWNMLQQLTLAGQLDALRGMAWAFAVLVHTGLSARAASRRFTPVGHIVKDRRGNAVGSNILYQYLRGERAPRPGPRGKLNFDLVGAIDKDPCGRFATPWLTHPIFEVFYPEVDLVGVRRILFSMPDAIRTRLFRTIGKEADPLYSRMSPFDEMAFLDFLRMGTLDALAAICALLREGQLTGNRRQAEITLMALTTRQEAFANLDPAFKYVEFPFFKMIALFYDQEDLRMKSAVSIEKLKELDRPIVMPPLNMICHRLDIDWRFVEGVDEAAIEGDPRSDVDRWLIG